MIDAPITTNASAASEFASAAGEEKDYVIRKSWIIQRVEAAGRRNSDKE